MIRSKAFIGKKINRLQILDAVYDYSSKRTYFLCKCDCGNSKKIESYSVKKGLSKSCGCLLKEIISQCNKTHGLSKTSEYKIWKNMKNRCYRTSSKGYKHYGGRGITVCKRWLKSFQLFISDVGKRPSPKHSLGRLDNNKGYKPSNCEWQTDTEQANNKTTSHFITFEDKTLTVKQFSKEKGIAYQTLLQRLNRFHWPIEKALTQPPRKKATPLHS